METWYGFRLLRYSRKNVDFCPSSVTGWLYDQAFPPCMSVSSYDEKEAAHRARYARPFYQQSIMVESRAL